MLSSRKCAYCGSEGRLAREHVFSKFFYSKDARAGYEKAISPVIQDGNEKFVQSEITISDVCRTCNNGFLSRLDKYGSQLYDQFLDDIPRPGDRIKFGYEFDLLTRWLLKLAYNAGRMRKEKWPGVALGILGQTTPYMRGETPPPRNLRLYVQLIVSTKLTPSQKQTLFDEEGLNLDEAEPRYRRVSLFGNLRVGRDGSWSIASSQYLIQINAFFFYVTFWDPALSRKQIEKSEAKFLREYRGAKWLNPSASSSVLYPSSLDWVTMLKKHPLWLQGTISGAEWVPRR